MKELLRNNKSMIVLSMVVLIILGMINQVTFYISLLVMVAIHILRKSTLEEWGLAKPKSWGRAILVSIGLTALMMLIAVGMEYIISIVVEQPTDVSRFDIIKENAWVLIGVIVSVWVSAAFGEEIVWRGYIMKQVALLLGDTDKAWIISLLFSSLLFGVLHFYQGPAGMIKTGVGGLFLGIVFIKNGKQNLWINILIHGLLDTIGMIYIFFS